ncbi:secretory lipase [Rhodococcus sp. OK302]|nr:lipase family protein [Rhodococcus sp. OK302]OYD70693.1 secretory lipase [Rhodococcus sp. OK302]
MRSGWAFVVVTMALLVAVPLTAQAQSSPNENFYNADADDVGTPGSVIRTQPLPLAGALAGIPGVGTRVLYSSTDTHDAEVAVSGSYLEPAANWAGPGPRPTVVIGPGTQGQGDQCAPSKMFPTAGQWDPATGSFGVNYEAAFAFAFLTQGIRVLVTDYIGLGTPGVHTYVNRSEEAHAMLDGARAALKVAHANPNDPIALWGHSQGGGATAAATELAPEYAPDLNLVGSYASAPPADLARVLRHIDGTGLMAAIGYTINGVTDRYPAARAAIESRLNDYGRSVLADVSGQCLIDSRTKYGKQSTASWTVDGRPLADVVESVPEILQVIEEQRIGRRTPTSPILVNGAINDDFIPYEQTRQLVDDWCSRGASATLFTDTLPAVNQGSGNNHLAPAVADFGVGMAYVLDRFNGKPVVGACNL